MQLCLALSGGGAAGLGHIPVLEALDELGVTPDAIAGTSIGALIGAAYSGGMTGRDIRAHVLEIDALPTSAVLRFLWNRMTDLSDPFPAKRAVEFLWPDQLPQTLEDLNIPFTAVATDFFAREAQYFRAGEITDVIAASIAIPGVFSPVRIADRLYVDGGVTNNLPLNVLPKSGIAVAVDVSTEPPKEYDGIPGAMETTAASMRIMMRALLKEQIAKRPDAIVIEPPSRSYGALEFLKVKEILEISESTRDEAKRTIENALNP